MYLTYAGRVIQFLAIAEVDNPWNRNDTTDSTEAEGDDYICYQLIHTLLYNNNSKKSYLLCKTAAKVLIFSERFAILVYYL